jgi:hypothetical protein
MHFFSVPWKCKHAKGGVSLPLSSAGFLSILISTSSGQITERTELTIYLIRLVAVHLTILIHSLVPHPSIEFRDQHLQPLEDVCI